MEIENTTIELQVDGEKVFTFPVSPESFEITSEVNHTSVNVNGLGETY